MADTRFDFSTSRIMLAKEENIDDVNNIFKDLYKKGDEMLDVEKLMGRIDCLKIQLIADMNVKTTKYQ